MLSDQTVLLCRSMVPIGQNELMLASYLHRIKSVKLTLQDLMKNTLKHEIYRYMREGDVTVCLSLSNLE